ncbi:MAG: thermonuclease family protein [Hydrotalea sp.]|nr:thermonuclease family protein [Hydrotalea sp.]
MTALIIFFNLLTGLSAQRVIGVQDGDSYTILHNGFKQRVRLVGVDAPELNQPMGVFVQKEMHALLSRKKVQLQRVGTDKHGRWLVKMWVDGMAVDSLLIRRGWAWYYPHNGHSDSTLQQLELMAKNRRIGLWSCERPVPPWIWRRMNEANRRLHDVCSFLPQVPP